MIFLPRPCSWARQVSWKRISGKTTRKGCKRNSGFSGTLCEFAQLSAQMRASLVINTYVPVLYAYGNLMGEQSLMDKAIRWLRQTPAEKNSQTARWEGVFNAEGFQRAAYSS